MFFVCRQEEIFRKHEEAIRERDLAIQEDLIKFCKFLQENEGKKNRADKRLQEEERARIQKEIEISELKAQQEELLNQQAKLEKKVKALKQYEEYLDAVIKANPDQYNDVTEILTR